MCIHTKDPSGGARVGTKMRLHQMTYQHDFNQRYETTNIQMPRINASHKNSYLRMQSRRKPLGSKNEMQQCDVTTSNSVRPTYHENARDRSHDNLSDSTFILFNQISRQQLLAGSGLRWLQPSNVE